MVFFSAISLAEVSGEKELDWLHTCYNKYGELVPVSTADDTRAILAKMANIIAKDVSTVDNTKTMLACHSQGLWVTDPTYSLYDIIKDQLSQPSEKYACYGSDNRLYLVIDDPGLDRKTVCLELFPNGY